MMTFIGCVGNAMVNSGLDEILRAAFGSVEKILNGNILKMVAEELLQPYLKVWITATN